MKQKAVLTFNRQDAKTPSKRQDFYGFAAYRFLPTDKGVTG